MRGDMEAATAVTLWRGGNSVATASAGAPWTGAATAILVTKAPEGLIVRSVPTADSGFTRSQQESFEGPVRPIVKILWMFRFLRSSRRKHCLRGSRFRSGRRDDRYILPRRPDISPPPLARDL